MNLSDVSYQKLNSSFWILKLTYGLLFVIAGADKFFNLVTNWQKYVSEPVLKALPVDLKTFIMIVGILEIILGLLILVPKWTQIGAYLAALWLILIAINLVMMGAYYDIAVRDAVMAVGAIVLGLLSSLRVFENR